MDSGEHNTECVIYDPSNNKIKNKFILRKSKLTFITNGKGLLMIFETKKSFTTKYRNKKKLLATSFFLSQIYIAAEKNIIFYRKYYIPFLLSTLFFLDQ